MGCAQSKPSAGARSRSTGDSAGARSRQGLHSQQEEFVSNNNKVSSGSKPVVPRGESSPLATINSANNFSTNPSHHSPPASHINLQPLPFLDGLGNLSEVWTNDKQWDKFKQYLDTFSEGEDSDGKPLSMLRYATFLELYARLDREYRRGEGRERMVQLVREIAEHEDGFLERERCLKCVDGGLRKDVMERVKNVKNGEEDTGPKVFILIYPRVVDKLGEMLGNYQNMIMSQNS